MIAVLRIGHRIYRDKRATTHVALVARAFGADKIFIDTKDQKIESTISSVCSRFGGSFKIESGISPQKVLKQWSGIIAHLTMYGDELNKTINKIDKDQNILIVVGAEKVPPYVYQMSDFNISVGNQPHSEIAALAIFLDRYTNGDWQKKRFDGKIEIVPSNKGKMVISRNEDKR